MLTPDENLIRAVERLIDGADGHDLYATIHGYRHAARDDNAADFARCEDSLRRSVLYRVQKTAPDSWKAAINRLVEQVNEEGAICKHCRGRKLHGERCTGDGKEICWSLREPCEGHDGRCCRCDAGAAGS